MSPPKRETEAQKRKRELEEQLTKKFELLPKFFGYMDSSEPKEAEASLHRAKDTLNTINALHKELTGEDPGLNFREIYRRVDQSADPAEFERLQKENQELTDANQAYAVTEEALKKKLQQLESRIKASSPIHNLFGLRGISTRIANKLYQALPLANVPFFLVKSTVRVALMSAVYLSLRLVGSALSPAAEAKAEPEFSALPEVVTPQGQGAAPSPSQGPDTYKVQPQFDTSRLKDTAPDTLYDRAMDQRVAELVGQRPKQMTPQEYMAMLEARQEASTDTLPVLTTKPRVPDPVPYTRSVFSTFQQVRGLLSLKPTASPAMPAVNVKQDRAEALKQQWLANTKTISVYDYKQKKPVRTYDVKASSLVMTSSQELNGELNVLGCQFVDGKTGQNVILDQQQLSAQQQAFFSNAEECEVTALKLVDIKHRLNEQNYDVRKNTLVEEATGGGWGSPASQLFRFIDNRTGEPVVLDATKLSASGISLDEVTYCPGVRLY
jgi:hypothetical protein